MDSRLDVDPDDPNGHILYTSFGREQINERNELTEFIETAPMLQCVTGEIATRILYDRVYGICQHGDPAVNDPLSLVGYHPKEDLYEGSDLAMLMRKFYKYRIMESFGLSLTEFLQYPMHVVDDLLDIAREGEETKARITREFKADK